MESDYVWMDGELVPYTEATVHVITPTLHYGVRVFEGIRSYQTPQGPAIFRLQDHLERFLESIQILGVMDYPYTLEKIWQAVNDTILANGFGEGKPGPVMIELLNLYSETVRGKGKRSQSGLIICPSISLFYET